MVVRGECSMTKPLLAFCCRSRSNKGFDCNFERQCIRRDKIIREKTKQNKTPQYLLLEDITSPLSGGKWLVSDGQIQGNEDEEQALPYLLDPDHGSQGNCPRDGEVW